MGAEVQGFASIALLYIQLALIRWMAKHCLDKLDLNRVDLI